MGHKLEHLAKLLGEALAIAEETSRQAQADTFDPQRRGEAGKIVSGIKYLRKQVADGKLEPSHGHHTLGILYVASENAHWDSPIVSKANELEAYYKKHLRSPDDFV